ncbi:hypothetical protein ACEN9D_20930 [Pseudomonas sp. CT11-2]|uniref:hypothetical protein n=1 Tax=Pseudomonas sp. CT11-2 TaxID=3243023 RepID=UPI0039AFF968
MVYDNFAGNWTYRSFINKPEILPQLDAENIVKDDVAQWSRYMFGQGLMIFHPTVTGGLTGLFRMGDDKTTLDMNIRGKLEVREGVLWVKWNAYGVANSESDGWLYEYEGYIINNWINGSKQVDSIVGSVIRSQPHDDLNPNQTVDRQARAGAVASFIMVRDILIEANTSIPLPNVVLQMLGSEHHRLHHAIWHGLRDNWVKPRDGELSPDEKKLVGQLDWAPPRPNQLPTRGTVADREPDNGAGEDFLFMHRQMIQKVRQLMANAGLPAITAWSTIPTPNRDSRNVDGFSVPPAWDTGNGEASFKAVATIKSDEYWHSRMTFIERRLKDPAYLSTLTLDQLGAKIEWLIHNLMHIRWSSQQKDPETLISIPAGRPTNDRSQKWIRTQLNGQDHYYDDLNDTFSSHVHPVFWRLHGWVDNRIDDWYRAQESVRPGKVLPMDYMGTPWFQQGDWVAVADPWIGPMHMMHPHSAEEEEKMTETMRLVYDLVFANSDPVISALRPTNFTEKVTSS